MGKFFIGKSKPIDTPNAKALQAVTDLPQGKYLFMIDADGTVRIALEDPMIPNARLYKHGDLNPENIKGSDTIVFKDASGQIVEKPASELLGIAPTATCYGCRRGPARVAGELEMGVNGEVKNLNFNASATFQRLDVTKVLDCSQLKLAARAVVMVMGMGLESLASRMDLSASGRSVPCSF